METYKNDYKKEEDYMMWELHEIRNKIANNNQYSEKELDRRGKNIIDKYGLNNIKPYSPHAKLLTHIG